MRKTQLGYVVVAAAAFVLATGTGSQAAPGSQGFHVTAPCDNGMTLDVIVPPGHGEWTSGSSVDGPGAFKVYAFTYVDTAADGTVDGPYTSFQAGGAVAAHNPRPMVTCTQTSPDGDGGTITIDIIGFFTP